MRPIIKQKSAAKLVEYVRVCHNQSQPEVQSDGRVGLRKPDSCKHPQHKPHASDMRRNVSAPPLQWQPAEGSSPPPTLPLPPTAGGERWSYL